MHLKRLLITLVALGFILTFNTSCENDRDYSEPINTLEAKDLANTYKTGKLIINAHEAEEEVVINVTVKENNEGIFTLKNLVTNQPEVTFTAPLTKKENGAYRFEHTGHFITAEAGQSYILDGSFVGTPEAGVTLVAKFENTKHIDVEDILNYKHPNVFNKGQYAQENFVVNGEPSTVGFSVYAMSARFTKSAEKINVVLSHLFFHPASTSNIAINDVQLVRSLEEPNTFTFLHFTEEQPSIVNDNNFRTITITKGVVVNDVVYVEASIVSKSTFVDTKWQVDKKNKENFNIKFTSRLAEEKLKDAERIEFLNKHHEVVAFLLFRINTVKFNSNTIADNISYHTNENEIVNLTTHPGAAFNFTSATSMGLGINEAAMAEISEQSNNRIILSDIVDMFSLTSNKYRYSQIVWGSPTPTETNSWTLPLGALRQAAAFAAISMPKTEADMNKMGFTMNQADIDELHAIFTHITARTTGVLPSYSINSGEVTIGIKKVN